MPIKGLFNRGSFVGDVTTKVVGDADKITYNVRDKVTVTGDTPYDFVKEEEVFEEERVSLDKYIQSFASDVGLDNLLRKIALTSDTSMLDAYHASGAMVDTRDMPTNNQELDDRIAAGKAKAAELGIDFTKEGIDAYIQKEIAAQLAAKNNEGGAE